MTSTSQSFLESKDVLEVSVLVSYSFSVAAVCVILNQCISKSHMIHAKPSVKLVAAA